jgi:hypothetical protein
VKFVQREEPTFHEAPKGAFTRNASRRFLACELEIASGGGSDVNRVVQKWSMAVVEDGSLPSSGFEVNTAPANGDLFVKQIEELCAALNDDGAAVNNACGYHVHIDARDFTYRMMQRLVVLYAKIEDALFECVPPHRRNNTYCHKCGKTWLLGVESSAPHGDAGNVAKKKLITKVYGDKAYYRSAIGDKHHSSRYNALNLHSWFYRGTIECRLGAGTTNARKVIMWATMWAGILDWCKSHTMKDVESLPTNSWGALQRVIENPDVLAWVVGRHSRFRA